MADTTWPMKPGRWLPESVVNEDDIFVRTYEGETRPGAVFVFYKVLPQESPRVWVLVCEKPMPNDHDVEGNLWVFTDVQKAIEGASVCDAHCSGPHQLYNKEISSWE